VRNKTDTTQDILEYRIRFLMEQGVEADLGEQEIQPAE
jgi:hypothetical protein